MQQHSTRQGPVSSHSLRLFTVKFQHRDEIKLSAQQNINLEVFLSSSSKDDISQGHTLHTSYIDDNTHKSFENQYKPCQLSPPVQTTPACTNRNMKEKNFVWKNISSYQEKKVVFYDCVRLLRVFLLWKPWRIHRNYLIPAISIQHHGNYYNYSTSHRLDLISAGLDVIWCVSWINWN